MACEIFDSVWVNARLATMRPGGAPYGAIEGGVLGVREGRIAFAGARAELGAFETRARHDAAGRWITPGLIDCHTHLIFGGTRADEFERRLKGESYAEIARAGGGIRATVRRTRAASEDELVATAAHRLESFIADGVTTIEIKSGYGLDIDGERTMLRAARRLGRERPIDIRTTFLGAHTLPAEYAERRADYVALVAGPMLAAVAREGLADAVDAFAETIAFTPDEVRVVFRAARAAGLPIKLHADQLSDGNGAALAAEFGALSADHLEHANEVGIAAMARAGCVAVLLPGAYYALGETRAPPIAAMRRHGVAMAIASDANPGSSPALGLRLMANLACTLFKLTPEEALAGMTVHSARALGLADRGALAPGQAADFVLWDVEHPAELAYWIGGALARQVVRGGRIVRG